MYVFCSLSALKKVRDIIEQQKAKLQQRPGGSGKKRASRNNDDKIMLLSETKKVRSCYLSICTCVTLFLVCFKL